MKKKIICIFIVLILAVFGGFFALRSFSISGKQMKLVQTEGAVRVSDETNQEKPVRKGMNLYSGYGVSTADASYAWIDLDKTKLLKMDESSSARLEKDGLKLKITMDCGDLFFCITKPLADDETLELTTSNMAMAVRGTTGIFRSISDNQSQLVLMEGKVTLADGQSISTGQVADLVLDEEGDASVFTRAVADGDVPEYVQSIIAENRDVKNKILSGGGRVDYMSEVELMAIYGDLIACYREALSGGRAEFGVENHPKYMQGIDNVTAFMQESETEPAYEGDFYGFQAKDPAALRGWQYAFLDINHDGYPELLIADNNLEKGYGIRDIWTTDGTAVNQVQMVPNSHQCWKLTANGYVANYEIAPHFDYRDVYYFEIAPSNGFGDCMAHTSEGSMGRPAWAGMVYDESGQQIFESESRDEFDAYIAENFPPIHDMSLNWRSFD